MIKKIITFIILIIGFINVSLGYFSPTTKINLPGNFVNGNIYNNITSKLDFENENGYYISINDGGNKYIIFWNGGELYNYGYYSYFNNYNQGRFKRFCSSEGTGYCTSNYTTGIALEFYDLENVNFTEMTVSVQSETDDPGLCFYNQINNKNYCTQVYDNTNNIILSGNLNIPNNTTDFSNYAEFSPFLYYNLNGGQSITINNTLTGDYVYTNCTNGEIIEELENAGFNKYMCYGGLDNFDLYDSSLNYSPIPGTGKSLSQILSNAISIQGAWDTPLEWFQFWDGLYQNRYINSYNAMWESYPAVYRTWFDIYYQYGRNLNKDFDWVREYCLMTVDFDLDRTAIYKGQFFKGVCDTVIDKKINSSYYVGSGNSVIGTNWDGVGNLSNSGLNDPVNFIQDYFNLAKENIPTRYDLGGGFLPLYIITFMCALILFRFLSH